MNIYSGSEGNAIKIEIEPNTNVISGKLKLSSDSGNILSIKDDGLYATAVDITGKADKITGENKKIGQIFVDDGNGNLAASKKTIEELKTEIFGNFDSISDEEINSLFGE